MPNLRIIYDNAAKRAVLTAASQAGSLGPANLQREGKGAVLRSVGTSLTITATLSVGEVVGAVILPFCNLTPNAKIRVRGYSVPGDTEPVIDSGTVLAAAYPPPALMDWGGTPLAVNAYSYGGGTYGCVWFEPDTARQLVIELTDPDNPAGYIEAAYLVMGNYWSPDYNASYGASMTPVDLSTQYRTAGNTQYVDRAGMYNKLALQLDVMTAADRAGLWRIVRGCGKHTPIFVSLFPEDGDPELEQAHQLYGRFSDLAAFSIPSYQRYATTIDVEEV